jgi:hypothetical protein
MTRLTGSAVGARERTRSGLVAGALLVLGALAVAMIAGGPAGAAAAPSGELGSCSVFPAPPASTTPTSPSLGTEAAWNQNISKAPRAANSAKVIAYINSHGDNAIHPDFGSPRAYGFPVTVVGAGAKKLPIHYTAYGSESSPGPFPIPTNAPVEGGAHAEGDRHVLVVDKSTCKLFELYNAAPQSQPKPHWDADAGSNGTSARPPCAPMAGPRPTPPACRSSLASSATKKRPRATSTTRSGSRWTAPATPGSTPPPTAPATPTPAPPRRWGCGCG